MERFDLVLNLHGEMPGSLPGGAVSLEEAFLPELRRLHERFPQLRCVLEARRSLLLAVRFILILYSITLPRLPWMPYGIVAHRLLVCSFTAISDSSIP